MRWKLATVALSLCIAALFWYVRLPREKPYFQLRGRHDLANLAKESLVALERGDFVKWRTTLPPGEASRYGLSNDELRDVFTKYLSPAFRGGVGEYQLSLNLDQGVGSCERMYWVNKIQLNVGASVAFQAVEKKWGYWNTLYATLSNAWLLEGLRAGQVQALPYSAAAFAAERDRKKLSALGLKHFPSSKPGVSVSWDQQINSLRTEAERRAKLSKDSTGPEPPTR